VSEPNRLVVSKALLAAVAALVLLWPLATAAGIASGVAGVALGYWLARRAKASQLRLVAGLALALLAVLLGHLGAQLILAHPVALSGKAALELADAVWFGAFAFGLVFGVRMLSQTARAFAVLELALVVGAAVHLFVDHRHHHIEHPRFLSDWAWSRGIDPSIVLVVVGVGALLLSALMLLDTRHPSRFVAALLLVGLIMLLVPGTLTATPPPVGAGASGEGDPEDGEGDGQANGDPKRDGEQGKGGGQSNKPPDPVAIALLHDELPEDSEVLYFRQSALSRFDGNRLVEDKSGTFDRDVLSHLEAKALRADSAQGGAFHRKVSSSVFLIAPHPQLFGLGHPFELRPLQNPNPRQFVRAYDVDSFLLNVAPRRLIGRPAVPPAWSEAERAHYLATPKDPRYRALSNRIVRDVDPRFVGDDTVAAFAIKQYLEKNGVYNASKKQLTGDDPTGTFLFGDLHGYCVHFAHAAALLLRTQGIPARVAQGYAVQTRTRGAGSAVLIMGNQAHAWPEVFVDGVGWVTFDIYPERSDEPPPRMVDVELESMLGELARKDDTAGRAQAPGKAFQMPWGLIGITALALLAMLTTTAYAIKTVRRLRSSSHVWIYRGVLDRLSELGAPRRHGESRERHAQRVHALAPSFAALTREHLRCALGGPAGSSPAAVATLARATRAELQKNVPLGLRILALLNPIAWWFTR